eukprot:4983492-Alexandrium_andersonii.AAC.1
MRLSTGSALPTRECNVPQHKRLSSETCAPKSLELFNTLMGPCVTSQNCLRMRMRVLLDRAKRKHLSLAILHPASCSVPIALCAAL